MTSNKIIKEFTRVGQEMRLDPAALMAVAELETALRAHATVNGRKEPLIRFEGHYFDRRLSPDDRETARDAGLASPRAGAITNPASQAARWKLLERAAAIDRWAAYESVSWGLGQVMGAHWDWLGYASVEEFVAEARSGVEGQVRLMARFIDKAGLGDALRRRDWAAFARGYNGPAFHRNAYDTRLADAYRRHAASFAGPAPAAERRPEMRGEDVRAIQADLIHLGFQLAADGIFGPVTERAIRDFQRQNGLRQSGLVCAATREAIARAARTRRAPSTANQGARILDRLFGSTLRLLLGGRRG